MNRLKCVLQLLASIGFIVAGIALLCEPASSQPAKAFAPTRFTVVDAGSVGKPDVVLIPGLSSSRAVWDVEAAKLAPNYRLHLLQINGFAGQPAGANASGEILPAIVEELHAYLGASKMHPAVIGHSLGGLLALMLAKAHPEDASKLIIVDTLPFYAVIFAPDATVASARPMAEGVKAQIVAMPQAQFEVMAPMTTGQLVNNADAKKLVAAMALASDRAVFAEANYEDLLTDLRGDVASIKTPTLMLYPYDAAAVPDPTKVDPIYQTAYKPMPNVKLVRVDDSRHFIMYDQPGKFDELLERFLKQ